MQEAWICGDCRSLNPARSGRCYKCRVPRAAGEMTDASAALSSSSAQRERTVLAAAARLGARYVPTWPLGIFVIFTIVVAAALAIDQINAAMDVFVLGAGITDADPRFQRLMSGSLAMLVASAVSVVAWCLWIAIVVANVPALVAKWPPNSPIGAFFAPFIPFIGFKRPYSVVRGVVALLSGGSGWSSLLALGWWLTFLAAYFAPTVVLIVNGSIVIDGREGLPAVANALTVRQVLLVPAAVLAIGVVLMIEIQQHGALRRRAAVAFE